MEALKARNEKNSSEKKKKRKKILYEKCIYLFYNNSLQPGVKDHSSRLALAIGPCLTHCYEGKKSIRRKHFSTAQISVLEFCGKMFQVRLKPENMQDLLHIFK